MIYEVNVNSKEKLYPLFKNMKDTMILSCLEGHMGTAWVDNIDNSTTISIKE